MITSKDGIEIQEMTSEKGSRIKIGTAIDACSAKDAIRKGVLCEKLGYDSIWLTDHLIDNGGIKIEPWSTIGAISAQTSKIIMSTAVTDTQRSHPARTAHSVATLAEISDGRVWLGIGAGEAMNLTPFGIPFDKPISRARRLAEAIQVIRLLWSSNRNHPVSFKGDYFALDNAWLDEQTKIPPPIYVGALGGRNALEVVGRYGDGWVSWQNTPATYRTRLELIKSAAKSAGRDPEKIGAALWLSTTFAEGGEELRDAINQTKRTILAEQHTLKLLGFKLPEILGSPYQDMLVSDKGDQILMDHQDMVPDEIALEFLACGSPSEVIEKIEKFREAGVTHVIAEFLELGEAPIRKYAEKVLPHFVSKD